MLLQNKTIIIVGNTRYDGPIQATSVFIAQQLAVYNTVYFVDYPSTIKDFVIDLFIKNSITKERRRKYSLFSDGVLNTNLPRLKIVVTPPVFPINFLPEGKIYRFLLSINEYLIRTRIKKILNSAKIQNYIFINAFNFHYPDITKGLNPSLIVYHCVDPMITPYDMKHGITSEKKIVLKSDIIICTSKALYLEKLIENRNTYFIPNATDSNLLKQVQQKQVFIHKHLNIIKKPIIGYLGSIERRINYELLEQVAISLPEYSFVMAGPIDWNFMPASLSELKNVHIIGAINYNEVPQLINGFDVAIIPFKKDEVSSTIFPIKLFEYLGAGKPVIATDFNDDLKDFTDDQVTFCHNAPLFTNAIIQALNNNSEELIFKRKTLAAKNTWENRSVQIAEIISKHLKD